MHRILILTLATLAAATTYEPSRKLGAEKMEFKFSVDGVLNGQCYAPTYTYYTSFKCLATENCSQKYCDNLVDPYDRTVELEQARVNRLLIIIIPSVVGGLILICSVCLCCMSYYGFQKAIEYYKN